MMLLPLAALLALAAGAAPTWPSLGLSPPLQDHVRMPCRALLQRYTSAEAPGTPLLPSLPAEEQARFTWNGELGYREYLVDDSQKGQGTHYRFGSTDLERYVKGAASDLEKQAEPQLDDTQARMTQPEKDAFFVAAVRRYKSQFEGARVAVFGSTAPYFEALALAAGASQVTTFEYNKLTYNHSRIVTLQPAQVDVAALGFDIAISASSFDHDGLGRYGDPLDPEGDLKAMRTAKCMLREGGLLLVSVPVGTDLIVYNLHRRYGAKRLPALFFGWELVDVLGWSSRFLAQSTDFRQTVEPVFVVRKKVRHQDL